MCPVSGSETVSVSDILDFCTKSFQGLSHVIVAVASSDMQTSKALLIPQFRVASLILQLLDSLDHVVLSGQVHR